MYHSLNKVKAKQSLLIIIVPSFLKIFCPDSKDLVPIPGCILTCNLHHHPILSKASHLIPANVLVSFDDVIPGLIPTRVQEGIAMYIRVRSSSILYVRIFSMLGG